MFTTPIESLPVLAAMLGAFYAAPGADWVDGAVIVVPGARTIAIVEDVDSVTVVERTDSDRELGNADTLEGLADLLAAVGVL